MRERERKRLTERCVSGWSQLKEKFRNFSVRNSVSVGFLFHVSVHRSCIRSLLRKLEKILASGIYYKSTGGDRDREEIILVVTWRDHAHVNLI